MEVYTGLSHRTTTFTSRVTTHWGRCLYNYARFHLPHSEIKLSQGPRDSVQNTTSTQPGSAHPRKVRSPGGAAPGPLPCPPGLRGAKPPPGRQLRGQRGARLGPVESRRVRARVGYGGQPGRREGLGSPGKGRGGGQPRKPN